MEPYCFVGWSPSQNLPHLSLSTREVATVWSTVRTTKFGQKIQNTLVKIPIAGLQGKPFKPFLTLFYIGKTLFSQFLWIAYFPWGLWNCPQMPFSEFIFAKKILGEDPKPPTTEGKPRCNLHTCHVTARHIVSCHLVSHKNFPWQKNA